MKHPAWSLLLTGLILLAFALPRAAAQDAAAGRTQMDEVVVEDSLFSDYSDEGVGANVLDGDDLTLWGADSPQDLPHRVPNFFATDTGTRGFGDVFSLRGLTNTTFFSSPSVVYYVDGVPFGDVFSYADRLFAVDHVDIFRGPQGTRFGRNAYGGVVDVHTQLPENEFHGKVGMSAGGYNHFGAYGYVTGALVDDVLKFRVGAGHSQREGFVDNLFLDRDEDSQESTSVNGALYWTPDERWEFVLSVTADTFDDGGPRLVSLMGDPYQVMSDLPGTMTRESNSEALRIAYDHDAFRLTSVTARREWDLDPYVQDLDLTSFPGASTMIRQDQTQWSEEIRISSPVDSEEAFRWSAGVYGATSDLDSNGRRDFIDPRVGPFPVSETTWYAIEQNDFALFADGAVDLSDSLRFNLGLRYDYIEKDLMRSKTSPLAAVPDFNFSDDFDHLTPSAGVEFDLCDEALVYATTSYAFKPGGFSAFTDTASLARYDSETNWASEIGVKASLRDDRVRTRLAAFYYDIEDYQIERTFTFTDFLVVNAEDATSYGVEFELGVEVCAGLTVDGSVGYVQTELDTFTDPVTRARLDGNMAPYVPEFDWALGVNYECECGIFTRLEYRGVGETYFDDLNRPAFKEETYGIVNAQVGYRDERFLIALFGSNLTDELYYTNKNSDLMAGSPGEPRQVGVMVQLEF